MTQDSVDVQRLIHILSDRTMAFFRDELDIDIPECAHQVDDVNKLSLRHLTSIMGAGGNMRLYLAFSFDQPLIELAFSAYASDIDVPEDEHDAYVEETAADIINIIVGNALAEFGRLGSIISLSPPIIITEAKHILRDKGAKFATANLNTPHGGLAIHLIGPKDLFDSRLDYV